jgi:phage replication initiation protein
VSILPKNTASGNPSTPWGDNLSAASPLSLEEFEMVSPAANSARPNLLGDTQPKICRVTGELLSDHSNGIYRNPAAKPLLSNTGAKTEKPQEAKARALVDYLGCTFKGEDALERAKLWFGQDWAEGKGGYYYKTSLRRGDVTIYHEHMTEDGAGTVFVLCRGKGCRQLEEEGLVSAVFPEENMTPWQGFLRELLQSGASFSRVDVAIDEYDGRLCLDTMHEYVQNGDCSTRFKEYDPRRPLNPVDGSVRGHTLYWGHRSSNMFVRMYRKDLEQIQKGVPVAEVPAGWVRVELQANDKKAEALVLEIIARGVSSVVEILWCALDFKDPAHKLKLATDRYKRRTASWWMEWLEASHKLRLSVDPSLRSIEKTIAWVARAVAPALHVIAHARSAGMGVLYALIESGGERLRETHVAMLLADSLSPSKVSHINSLCPRGAVS